jgi:hypothetical protein
MLFLTKLLYSNNKKNALSDSKKMKLHTVLMLLIRTFLVHKYLN